MARALGDPAGAPLRDLTLGTIALHIVPRARATAVAGTHGESVKIRVAAPPVDGAANVELVRFLADRLNVAASRVTIVGGANGRRKIVGVEGMEAEKIRLILLAPARHPSP